MRIYLGSQNGAIVHYWAGKYPDLVGQCFSPPQFYPKPWMPYFLDNGAYKYYANKQLFNEDAFFDHLSKVKLGVNPPEFVVIPDSVGDHIRTLEMWRYFYPKAIDAKPKLKYAFVVQDGCTPNDVPSSADLVFIGGTDKFKKPVLKEFADAFRGRIHVGRVNNLDFVFTCYEMGITSVDGTGWFRSNHGNPTYTQLEKYFEYRTGNHRYQQMQLLH